VPGDAALWMPSQTFLDDADELVAGAPGAGAAGGHHRVTLYGMSVGNELDRRRAATHEAAHAVCGRILHLRSGGASIIPDGRGYDGHAVVATALTINNDLIERGDYRDFRSAVLDKLMVCLAGPEAETMAFGDEGDARGDVRQIQQLQSRYYISDVDVERLRPQVHALLLRHWDKVEAVATALLERGTLSGEDIAGITSGTG
jgi:ATP-dependent Zn protease